MKEMRTADQLARSRSTDKRVWCDAVPVVDGWTNEQVGMMSGVHIIYRMPADRKCPHCGSDLGR